MRPADLLEPFLNKIPEEVKSLAKKEEDLLSYALFPQQTLSFLRGEAKKEAEAAQIVKANMGVQQEAVNPSSTTARIRRLRVSVGDEVFEILFEEL